MLMSTAPWRISMDVPHRERYWLVTSTHEAPSFIWFSLHRTKSSVAMRTDFETAAQLALEINPLQNSQGRCGVPFFLYDCTA